MKNIDEAILSLNQGKLEKLHRDLYDSVLEYVSNTFVDNTDSFREKFYVYYHDLQTRPVCKSCGGRVNFWKFDAGYKQFCSNTCAGNYKRSLPQNLKDATNAKRKATCKTVYGVENVAKNTCVKDKALKTNLEKYGAKSPLLNKAIQEKRQRTFKKNWGTHPLCVGVEKRTKARKETMTSRWAANTVAAINGKYKIVRLDDINRLVEIYCKECNQISSLTVDNVKQRTKSMILCMTCNPLYSDKSLKNQQTLDKYKTLNIPDTDILSFHKKVFTCKHVSKDHEFVINTKILYDRFTEHNSVVCTICNPVGSGDSSHQIAIKDFLELHHIDYIYNDKSVLGNKDLDFYIPVHNLAIEFNGVYWHSEVYKDDKYHLDKTLKCLEKGIKLLHIFEDDWVQKSDIVKSMLLNNLNLVPTKIYARKCVVKEVKSKEANLFLNTNHIQGACNSSIKYGLYHDNILVSLMTFGYRKTNAKREFELVRFCNVLNTNVIGGASRLFKHFLKNTTEKNVLSYSDLSLFDGKMYKILGFKRIHLSKPNYFWVVNGKREHRYKFNKKALVKEGFDPNKTEVAIMHERGFYRIWGCGQVRWVYQVL